MAIFSRPADNKAGNKIVSICECFGANVAESEKKCKGN